MVPQDLGFPIATKQLTQHFLPTAKPSTALVPYRSLAAISTSPSKSASAVPSPYDVNAPQPPVSVTGKVKREVPLASQEGKKGVMQYALYAPFLSSPLSGDST
jgi:hypothetical protein